MEKSRHNPAQKGPIFLISYVNFYFTLLRYVQHLYIYTHFNAFSPISPLLNSLSKALNSRTKILTLAKILQFHPLFDTKMSPVGNNEKNSQIQSPVEILDTNGSQDDMPSPVECTPKEKHRLFIKRELKKTKSGGEGEHVKSELERYLAEELEDEKEDDDNFGILQWWKDNAHKFPILSKLARDVLVVPVSSVATEAAFSIGGRVLDSFRSSLLPKTVQALICSQDWLGGTTMPSIVEDIEHVHKLEQEYSKLNIGSSA